MGEAPAMVRPRRPSRGSVHPMQRLSTVDKILLLTLLPCWIFAFGMHVREVARTGFAQPPIFAAPPATAEDYPTVGGFRLERYSRDVDLRVGDRLIRIGDVDLRGVGYILFDAHAGAQTGTALEAPLIFERDGKRHETVLRVRSQTIPWYRIPVIFCLAFISVIVLLRSGDRKQAQRLYLALMGFAIFETPFYGSTVWQTLLYLGLFNFGGGFVLVLLTRFLIHFPPETPPPPRRLMIVPWIMGLIWFGIRANYIWGGPAPSGWVPSMAVAWDATCLLVGIGIATWNYRRTDVIGRRRIKWFMYGAYLSGVPLALALFVPAFFPASTSHQRLFEASILLSVALPLGFLIAIVRYNLLDIDRLITATASYTAITALLLVGLLTGVPPLANALASALGLNPTSTQLILALLTAGIVVPTHQRLRPALDRFFFVEREARERGFEGLIHEVTESRDIREMLARVGQRVADLLDAAGCVVYAGVDERFEPSVISGTAQPRSLGADAPLVVALAGRAPIELDPTSHPDAFADTGGWQMAEDLRESGVAVPIWRPDALAGFLWLGPKRSGDIYTENDLAMLDAVADRMSSKLLRADVGDVLDTRVGRFFWAMTARPRIVVALGFAVLALAAANFGRLTTDTSTDAFIRQDDPAMVYHEQVREVFGLQDPMVLAVVNDGPHGVFNPQTLRLVSWLSERIAEAPGIDPGGVKSLATEDDIIGTEEGLEIEPFYEEPPVTQAEADRIRDAVLGFELYVGSIVSADGATTLIVAELEDESQDAAAYQYVKAMLDEAPVDGETIHLAGDAALIAALGDLIDADARVLNPIAGVIVTLILLISYGTTRGVLLPHFLVVGSIVVAIGSMGALGVPIYVLTNALPVVLIAVGVADGVHILGEYYEQLAGRPTASQREIVVRAMTAISRSITITSLTDIAGFGAIAIASTSPPVRAFGGFAVIGVAAALFLSLLIVPALLAMMKKRASDSYRPRSTLHAPGGADFVGKLMSVLGRAVSKYPGRVAAVWAVAIAVAIVGALRVTIDGAVIENFPNSSSLSLADRAINRSLDGTNYLDIVVESDVLDGLFQPENLRQIEALQEHFESMPDVGGTTSIVDYLKQMNRVVNEDRPEAYRIPESQALASQYMLLYSLSGDPMAFEQEIDSRYQLANVRVTMTSGRYSAEKTVVEAATRYLDEHFDGPGISARLSGRVNVHYLYFDNVAGSHFTSTLLAVLAVWVVASLCFRSAVAGTLAILPVSLAVLMNYAVLGYLGVPMDVAGSVCGAVAVGVGVDFALHLLDRLIVLLRHEQRSMDEAFEALFPSTGRAIFFSFVALMLGFSVLLVSELPSLIRMGALVGTCALVSFLASMTLIPMLVQVLRPRFLGIDRLAIPQAPDVVPETA